MKKKKRTKLTTIIGRVIGTLLVIAALFGSAGLAVKAIRWFVGLF